MIVLKMRQGFRFEVDVEAELVDGKIVYQASVAELTFVSHFDPHEIFAGASLEEAVASLAKALDHAIATLRDELS